MDEAMAAARSETDREASGHQLDAFHKTFNFCLSCRQYTCPNCWNDAEARCLTCAPLALPETPAITDLRDFREAALFGDTTLIGEAVQTNGLPDHQYDFDVPAAPFVDQAMATEEAPTVEAAPVAETPGAVGFAGAEAATDLAVAAERPIEAVAAEVVEVAHEEPVAAATVEVQPEPVASDALESLDTAIRQDEPVAAGDVEIEELVAAELPVEPTLAAEPPVALPVQPPLVLPADPAGKAAAQTTGLLQRFRPGQSLDDALAAFEREREDAEATVDEPAAAAEPAGVAAELEAEAGVAVQGAEPIGAAEELEAQPVEAVPPELEPEPSFAALDAEPALDAEEAALDGPEIPQPEGALAAQAPSLAVEPEVAAEEPIASLEPEPAPLAAAAAEDVVEQPTWRITAPDPTAPTATRPPAGGETGVPIQASGAPVASPEPQWPSQPQWPSSTPAAGLPFLGRPAAPQGGIDALWAASNQELVTAAPSPQGKAESGIQPCVSCGLSLSANARFCRRCGTLQGR
jgi:hypothetical protein